MLKYLDVRIEVFMTLTAKIVVFWVVTPCSLWVDINLSEEHAISFRVEVCGLRNGLVVI
jgi:hypothetical protein